MTFKVKLRKIGNSLGFVIPKETLLRLDLIEGDTIFLTVGADQTPFLSQSSERSRKATKALNAIASRYKNALRELAD